MKRGLHQAVQFIRELLTAVHVLSVMILVELLIRWVSLPHLSDLLGVRVNLEPPDGDAVQIGLGELPPRAARQVRCARRVAGIWPFGDGPCLRRSLVVGHLLRRHGAALRLGVADDGDLPAHAWVEIADRPLESIVGFSVFHRTRQEAAG